MATSETWPEEGKSEGGRCRCWQEEEEKEQEERREEIGNIGNRA